MSEHSEEENLRLERLRLHEEIEEKLRLESSRLHEEIEEKLRLESSRLDNEVKDLQKIYYTLRGAGLAGTILLAGYLGFTQLIQLPKVLEEVIPNAVQSYIDKRVPTMVDGHVSESMSQLLPEAVERQVENYISERSDVFGKIDEVQNHILISEKKAVESVAAIDSILQQVQSIERGSRSYSTCEWVDVGYDKSHEKVGDWCKEGYFLTQLDLAGGVGPPGSWPIVEQARCCKP